jgi:hypothetical protein
VLKGDKAEVLRTPVANHFTQRDRMNMAKLYFFRHGFFKYINGEYLNPDPGIRRERCIPTSRVFWIHIGFFLLAIIPFAIITLVMEKWTIEKLAIVLFWLVLMRVTASAMSFAQRFDNHFVEISDNSVTLHMPHRLLEYEKGISEACPTVWCDGVVELTFFPLLSELLSLGQYPHKVLIRANMMDLERSMRTAR